MDLSWDVSFDGGASYKNAGTSSNDVYLTLNDPAVSPLYNTVVHIGSSEADGETEKLEVLKAIRALFETLNVDTVGGKDLHYYKTYTCNDTSTAKLLETGNGTCSSWANLFIQVVKAQGIVEQNNWIVLEMENPTDFIGFLVKDWSFDGLGTAAQVLDIPAGHPFNAVIAANPYINVFKDDILPQGGFTNADDDAYEWIHDDVSDLPGVPGQSTSNPASIFAAHVVVQYDFGNGLEWFDPSYGTKYQGANLAARAKAFEDNAIDGFYGTGEAKVKESEVNFDLNNDGDTGDSPMWWVMLIRKNDPNENDIVAEEDTI